MTMRRRALEMAASGLLVSLSFPSWLAPGMTPWTGWLAWVALIPALRALDGASPRQALLLGWLGGSVRWGSTVYWIAAIREMELYRFPAWVLFAALLGGYHGVWAWFVARAGAARRTLAAPAAWIVVEWLQGRLFTGFPWTPLGASQWGWPPVFAWAAVIGVAGLAWPIVAVNALWARSGWRPDVRAVILAASLAAGGVPLVLRARTVPETPALRVALLQGAFTETEKWSLEPAIQIARYEGLAGKASREGELAAMVWPETATVSLIESAGLVPRLQALARRTGAAQLVGALSQDVEFRVRNGAFVIGPGGVAGGYHKNRLVPFGEYVPAWFRWLVPIARKLTDGLVDMTPGTGTEPLVLPGGVRAGVMVCYEAAFADHARRCVASGAEVFVNITNDAWYGRTAATCQHALGPVARAVECGRTVLRCANTGLTLAASPDGRVTHALPLFAPGIHVVTTHPRTRRTPYSRWGDWPMLAVALAALTVALRRSLRG